MRAWALAPCAGNRPARTCCALMGGERHDGQARLPPLNQRGQTLHVGVCALHRQGWRDALPRQGIHASPRFGHITTIVLWADDEQLDSLFHERPPVGVQSVERWAPAFRAAPIHTRDGIDRSCRAHRPWYVSWPFAMRWIPGIQQVRPAQTGGTDRRERALAAVTVKKAYERVQGRAVDQSAFRARMLAAGCPEATDSRTWAHRSGPWATA